jgi:hypothetical protein
MPREQNNNLEIGPASIIEDMALRLLKRKADSIIIPRKLIDHFQRSLLCVGATMKAV